MTHKTSPDFKWTIRCSWARQDEKIVKCPRMRENFSICMPANDVSSLSCCHATQHNNTSLMKIDDVVNMRDNERKICDNLKLFNRFLIGTWRCVGQSIRSIREICSLDSIVIEGLFTISHCALQWKQIFPLRPTITKSLSRRFHNSAFQQRYYPRQGV